MNDDTKSAIDNAMTAAGEAPGTVLFYDILAPDPEHCPDVPRFLVGVSCPEVKEIMPGMIAVRNSISGNCLPIRPEVIRNILKKMLAKLDEMYPADSPDKQKDEELTQRVLDCGNFADVFEPGR